MSFPTGVALGPSGRLYLIEKETGRVQMFTTDGEFLAKWNIGPASGGEPYDEFRSSWLNVGIAVVAAGNVYAVVGKDSLIKKFSPSRDLLR